MCFPASLEQCLGYVDVASAIRPCVFALTVESHETCTAGASLLNKAAAVAPQHRTGSTKGGARSNREEQSIEPVCEAASEGTVQDGVLQPVTAACTDGDGRKKKKKKKRKLAEPAPQADSPVTNAGGAAEEKVGGKKQKKHKSKSKTAVQPQATVEESKDAQQETSAEANNPARSKYAPNSDKLCASA